MRSFDDESLSGPVSVRYDGYVSLPLIPDIHVQDVTRAQAIELVREAYSKVFNSPRISLSITQVGSKIFFVMGDVRNPNEYSYVRPITLLDAINTAGGPRIDSRGGDSFIGGQGQLTHVFVIRHIAGERQVLEYDLKDLTRNGSHASDAPIFPFDIVYVPEGRNLVYILGEVQRPGVFELNEGMTVVELLTLAGGPTLRTSRLSQVVLVREIDETNSTVTLLNIKKMMKTGAIPLLQPGDILFVPRKNVTRVSDFVGQFAAMFSPILSLYNQAFDAYYADKRARLFFGSGATSSAGTAPASLGAVQQFIDSAADSSASTR